MSKIMHLVPVYKEYSETFIWKHVDDVSSFFDASIVVSSKLKAGSEQSLSLGINLIIINGKDTNLYRKIKFKLQSQIGSPIFFKAHELMTEIDNYNPTVIHAHFGYFIGDILWLSKKYQNMSFIVSFHGTDINKVIKRSAPFKAVLKSLAEHRNVKFVFPSVFLRDVTLNLLNINHQPEFIVLANPVDDAFINSWCRFQNKSKLRLVSVGRLESVKGFEYSIKAVALLKNEGYEVSYTIIGEGSKYRFLKSLVNKYSLEDSISFAGRLERKEIISYLSQSNVYLQPSVKLDNGQEESFGVSALEAAVSGIPIVVSNSGGLPSVIDKENPNHYCVKEKSSEAIYKAVVDIFNNIDSEYSNPSYINKFQSNKILNDWRNVYFD